MTYLLETEINVPVWRAELSERPLTGLTVLVVEDSRFASEAVRLLCLRSGARIRRADSLRSARVHLQTYRPGVVLVDLGLPDGSGLELIADLHKMRPRVPVLLGLSGDPDGREAALAAGADGFLVKPVESLAVFQEMILGAFPPDARCFGLRLLSDEQVCPDRAALRDDLSHMAEVIANARHPEALDYIAGFLAGVARSTRDDELEHAARALSRNRGTDGFGPDLALIGGLVRDRLAAVGG